ncbi:MAG: sigma-70 family RNA polymerase sigma factor [Planctomycetes bacterium]|nr:sigma-70 family RNA polymerase sigma factor [Planctomycetota bacterium]
MVHEIADQLKSHDFVSLFIETLGWDRAAGIARIRVDDIDFELRTIAHKRGFKVIHCPAHRYTLMNRGRLRRLQRLVRKFAHEHIVIYTCEEPRKQVWQWAIERPGQKSLMHREHPFFSDMPPEGLLARLGGIVFAIGEEERVTLADALERVRLALDVPAELKLFVGMPWYCEQSDILAREMRNATPGARERFILFHTKLAKWGARKGRGLFGLDEEDCFQDAAVGLIQAADRYDPDRGQFSTYAFHWMRQACQRFGQLEAISAHVPPSVYWRFRRVNAQAARAEARSGPGSTHRLLLRLALRAGLDPRRYRRLAASVGVARFGDYGHHLWQKAAQVADDYPDPLRQMLSQEIAELVGRTLKNLDKFHARLLVRRFGLEGERSTLQEIADDVGLSRERVRQLESKAIEELVKRLRSQLPLEYREMLQSRDGIEANVRARSDQGLATRDRVKSAIAACPEGIGATELAACLAGR